MKAPIKSKPVIFIVNSFEKKDAENNGYSGNQQTDAYQCIVYEDNVFRQEVADYKGCKYDLAKINKYFTENLGIRV